MLVRSLDFVVNDVAALLAEPDAMRRDEKLQGLIASIEFNEIPVTLQFLQRQEQTEVLQDLQVLLIRKGASTNPQVAAAWADQMPAGATRSASIAGVGVVWANQNLPEAARWASELAEGEDRENGLGRVAFEAARTKPIFALELSANLAPNDARDELVRHAARQWAAEDPTGAAAWAGEMTNPNLREQILADIAAAWAEKDPGSAAALALQSLSGGQTGRCAGRDRAALGAERTGSCGRMGARISRGLAADRFGKCGQALGRQGCAAGGEVGGEPAGRFSTRHCPKRLAAR